MGFERGLDFVNTNVTGTVDIIATGDSSTGTTTSASTTTSSYVTPSSY